MSAPLNDNSHLEYTQELRRKLIDRFRMPNGELPDDPKTANIILTALKDHDKVTLTLKRIDADKEIGDQEATARAQFHIIAGMLGTRDPSRSAEPVGEIPNIDVSSLPAIELVEGELEKDAAPIDYDELLGQGTVDSE